jgi:transcriptional regulator with XRE-family HTH domain
MSIIKIKREQLGFTQIDLSEKTGLSLITIQRLEASNK